MYSFKISFLFNLNFVFIFCETTFKAVRVISNRNIKKKRLTCKCGSKHGIFEGRLTETSAKSVHVVYVSINLFQIGQILRRHVGTKLIKRLNAHESARQISQMIVRWYAVISTAHYIYSAEREAMRLHAAHLVVLEQMVLQLWCELRIVDVSQIAKHATTYGVEASVAVSFRGPQHYIGQSEIAYGVKTRVGLAHV